MEAVASIIRRPFVGWLLCAAAVVAFVQWVPYEWFRTADQERVDAIAAATERMMPSDLAFAIGQASANAAACLYDFQEDGAEIALHSSNFEMRHIEMGGMLHGVYNDGYQSGSVNGRPPAGFCDAAYLDFGPQGRIIPTLLRDPGAR